MILRIRTIALAIASLVAVLPFSLSSLTAQDVAPAPADAVPAAPATEGMEVMTRGVVHEAFAEVVSDPKPGIVVSKRPPEAIEEVPPEFKPEEEGAIWISGYWVWDDERNDFFWQSGVWRVPPPGMRWVAGYWNETPDGWQWVSGFWVPVEEKEVRYYSAPPASLEAGPTGPSPGDDYFWATGSWTYYDTGYRWQPGYWAPYQENWVWVPARYVWTPAGCVFLPGRWDFRLTRRGCLFAPVYFTQPVYLRPNYIYRPWCALNTPNLFVHLWVRPNYGHFYFGNYYGSNWNNWGVTPWCQYRPYRNCYDPVLTQLQCHYRQQGVNYIGRLDGWHNHYASNVSARPPRTWNEQVRIVNNTTVNNININKTKINHGSNLKQNLLAVNLQDAAGRNQMAVKFAHLDGKGQKQAIDLAKETRDVRQHRMTVERPEGRSPDLTKKDKKDTGKRDVGKPELSKTDPGKSDPGKRGPLPGMNGQVRLKLPTTHTTDIVKEKDKHVPPKLKQAPTRTELPPTPGGSKSTPGGTRTPDFPSRPIPPGGPVPRPGPDGNFPATTTPGGSKSTTGGTKTPDFPSRPIPPGGPVPRAPLPRAGGAGPHAPAPGAGASGVPDLPPQQPKVEMPQRKPRGDNPRPQPKLESTVPHHELRERPQIKLDIPRPNVKVDSAPHVQPKPQSQIQPQVQPAAAVKAISPDVPRHEPQRSGGSRPHERKKKE